MSSGELRLLRSAGALVTLFYAVWTIVGVSVTTQLALGVEKADRSPGLPRAVPRWAAEGQGTVSEAVAVIGAAQEKPWAEWRLLTRSSWFAPR